MTVSRTSAPPRVGSVSVGTASAAADTRHRVRTGLSATVRGAAAGALGMTFVGGSVAVTGTLAAAPLFTAESVRYTAGCLLLLAFARKTGRPVLLPRRTEWVWLAGIAATGLVLFNVALADGARDAEPAVFGVAVASVPTLLAVAGPLLQRSRPVPRTVIAAVVLTCGAALVQGLGRGNAAGFGWALVIFCCEAAFTLLAVPVLGRHGPLGVSVHTTWIAAVIFGVLGIVGEGPAAAAHLSAAAWLATAYLAVGPTAVAFVLWFTCVGRLGPGRAGLLAGVAPIAATVTGICLGGPAPRPLVWAGMAVVAAGLALGIRDSSG